MKQGARLAMAPADQEEGGMAYIVVDEMRCKGCEICTATCPEHVIAIGEHFNPQGYRPALLMDPEQRCTGCTLCARMCPDVAIEVYR